MDFTDFRYKTLVANSIDVNALHGTYDMASNYRMAMQMTHLFVMYQVHKLKFRHILWLYK